MALTLFHPAVSRWFERHFERPTEAQSQAWPAIHGRRHALIAAPTGSGKTLAAFLAAIDGLVRQGLERGLADEIHVLYVSPLKALSNDIQKNLQQPLLGIRDELLQQGLPDVDIRAWVRTGDTPQKERERMRRQPPHIIVTTPESLYLLLTSESGRRMLGTVRTVIVDEIHALAGSKRGSHLTLSLERLTALCHEPPVRVGLSATQRPIDEVARFLTGAGGQDCTIIDIGHARERDLAIEVPDSPLEAIMSNEVWQELYERLAELIRAHRTTLIFVNTRRLAERAARFLAERIGEDHVTAHHGSLAREHRLQAEQRLKEGGLRALVATASLELGIDIGDVDLVCQLGSPRSIAVLLQRVGRSGHAVGALPKGRLFPLSRDDLLECAALLDAVRRGELDRIVIPQKPLDVLAQQIVAEVSAREWEEDALYLALKAAWPYRDLSRDEYNDVVRMLAEGFSTRRGRRSAYLHHDAVNGRLRGRRGARLSALLNGGAIPDQFDSEVILSPEGVMIGTLNEDFAFESLPGDIFQLGNTSYRILKVEQGKVYVADARGQPPNIPFWFGEAPGRSDELSHAVSRLREGLAQQLDQGPGAAATWLEVTLGMAPQAARPLAEYLAAAKAALGVVPSQQAVVLERFFDQAGDMHLVIHSPFGSRLNRAWGLALRKRFCRKFNFELQAAALEDSIVLSLGPTHSFPLDEVAGYLKSASVREVLTQALLDAPMFATRWRWNANIALAVKRNRNGKRVPPQFQRMDAEDLMAVVFPDQLACLENIRGQREVPDHPLVRQCIADCLTETMDIDGLEWLLARIERNALQVIARDLNQPSALAQEILNARPYAFLDDAPAEERRTLAVQSRRFLDPESAADLGRLDPAAIARVRQEAWPDARTADELHDALVVLGFLTQQEGRRGPVAVDQNRGTFDFGWTHLFEELAGQHRAAAVRTSNGAVLWVAAERLAQIQAIWPDAVPAPPIPPLPKTVAEALSRQEALRELIRGRLEGRGPVTVAALSATLGLPGAEIQLAIAELEQEGFVVQGRFTEGADATEWCERRLLARIHRYTINTLRSEIEPVCAAELMRFLFLWQHLGEERGEGVEAVAAVVTQLQGYSIAAAAWERDILPARVRGYVPALLDQLCASGRIVWMRLAPPRGTRNGNQKAAPVSITPIALIDRKEVRHWRRSSPAPDAGMMELSSAAQKVLHSLQHYGASFFVDLVHDSALLRTQVEEALSELVARGLVTSDGFIGLRALIAPASRRPGFARRRRHRASSLGVDDAGRWVLLDQDRAPRQVDPEDRRAAPEAELVEHIARTLLCRYGVVFRGLLERETGLPSWRELLYVYHRMEARGEIRGGRFVQAVSGEQFALPEAVGLLRGMRHKNKAGELVVVSATDPLNLAGIITPGQRVPAQPTNRILYRDGVPLALQIAGQVRFLDTLDQNTEWEARHKLVKRHNPAGFISSQSRPI